MSEDTTYKICSVTVGGRKMLQAIREIHTVEHGEIRLPMPTHLWGQHVEIIVLPMPAQERPAQRKKSLRGCLQQYANPALIPQEELAWAQAVQEEHEHSSVSGIACLNGFRPILEQKEMSAVDQGGAI